MSAHLDRLHEWYDAWMFDHTNAGIEVTPDECAEQWLWSRNTAIKETVGAYMSADFSDTNSLTELEFLNEIGSIVSNALWSEPELSKKEKLLQSVSRKISNRLISLLPPNTPLSGSTMPQSRKGGA